MNDHIFTQAERLRKKYRTRDPYEALEEMNVVVMYSNAFARDGLKGFLKPKSGWTRRLTGSLISRRKSSRPLMFCQTRIAGCCWNCGIWQ